MDSHRISKLLPTGKRVEIPDCGVTVVVFPLAVRQIRRAEGAVRAIISSAAKATVAKGASEMQVGAAIAEQTLPTLLGEGFALLDNTTVVGVFGDDGTFIPEDGDNAITVEDIPHYHLAEVLDAWWELNFEDEAKVRPWLSLIEKAVRRLTGKPFSISDWFARNSSERDITSSKSSNDDKPAPIPMASSSPIADGQSTN